MLGVERKILPLIGDYVDQHRSEIPLIDANERIRGFGKRHLPAQKGAQDRRTRWHPHCWLYQVPSKSTLRSAPEECESRLRKNETSRISGEGT